MKTWILVAILTLLDGSPGPTLEIEQFHTKTECMERASDAWDIVAQINQDWEIYMNDTGDIRPLETVFMTCQGQEVI